MSRPLKFRVWSNEARAYVTNPFIGPHPLFMLNLRFELGWIDDSWDGQVHPGYVFEQWTGLVDRNGRDIYENDIVRVSPEGVVAAVGYRRSLAGYSLYIPNAPALRWDLHLIDRERGDGWMTSGNVPARTCEPDPTRFEVIGNLHESPQLLNPSQQSQ